jgi:hypothetical protein
MRSLMLMAALALLAPRSAFGMDLQTVVDAPENTWITIPGTALSDAPVVADPNQYPFLMRAGPVYNITDFGGAVWDPIRNRLLILGGGHNSYDGNELYGFEIATMSWTRLTDPSPPNLCGDPNADGTPNARHTFNGFAYVDHADKVFMMGGAMACEAGACGSGVTWLFEPGANQWANMNPSGSTPVTTCGNAAAYDPIGKKVWWLDGNMTAANGLWSYDVDTNQWEKHNEDLYSDVTLVVDTKRRLLIGIGNGEVIAYDIGNGDYTAQVWDTTGGDAFIANGSPGVDYDPTTDRIVGFSGGELVYGDSGTGGAVFALDLDTKAWSTYQPRGTPNTAGAVSIYGLWRYIAGVNAFILMPHASEPMSFYKFSVGGEVPPPAPPPDDPPSTSGTGGTPGAAGAGGALANADGEAGGCGCRLAATNPAPAWIAFALLGLTILRGARRARSRMTGDAELQWQAPASRARNRQRQRRRGRRRRACCAPARRRMRSSRGW